MSTLTRAEQTQDSMFKQDRGPLRNPLRSKRVASTDNVDQTAKPPLLSAKFCSRPIRTIALNSRTSSALASLTRFHPRNSNQLTTNSNSVRERKNDEVDGCNTLNLPSIGTTERNMTSIILTSQTTAKVSNEFAQKYPRGLVGLQNLGNTCFMNSCLQCVSNLPDMVKYFQAGCFTLELNEFSPTKGVLATTFGELIKALWSGDKFSAIRPVGLKRVIGKVASRFTGYEQQDAQEFLRFLLDGLHEDLNRVKMKPVYYEIKDRPEAKDRDVSDEYWKFYAERNASALSELFCGQLRSEIRCETCNHRSVCFDVFWDLSLPIPKKHGKNNAANHLRLSSSFFSGGKSLAATNEGLTQIVPSGELALYDCLKAYTEDEFLSDEAAYFCAKCKTQRSVGKKISIYRLPNVLVLHLKRFSFSALSREKVSTKITFPAQHLDLAHFCAKDAVVDGSTLYDLTGIVHHMGTLNGGHYTAECLNADTNEWFHFNDGSVTAVKKPELSGSTAYMLFYQRREEKTLTI